MCLFVSSQSTFIDTLIGANIDLAIRKCKEERNLTLSHGRQMQIVKESLNEGYCDISGHEEDMAFICEPIQMFLTCQEILILEHETRRYGRHQGLRFEESVGTR